MFAKRIIPRLELNDGRLEKSPGTDELAASDPVELARFYDAAGADELLLIDHDRTSDRTTRLAALIEAISREVFLPLIVGGGLTSVAQMRSLLRAGADRVIVQSGAFKDPEMLRNAVNKIGSDRILLGIYAHTPTSKDDGDNPSGSDTGMRSRSGTRRVPGGSPSATDTSSDAIVVLEGGARQTGKPVVEWAQEGADLGVGELLITSVDRLDQRIGFDIPLIQEIAERIDVPILASGGAGTPEQFVELFQQSQVSGAVAAQIFHYKDTSIRRIKRACRDAGLPTRLQAEEGDEALQGADAGRLPEITETVPTPPGPTPDAPATTSPLADPTGPADPAG